MSLSPTDLAIATARMDEEYDQYRRCLDCGWVKLDHDSKMRHAYVGMTGPTLWTLAEVQYQSRLGKLFDLTEDEQRQLWEYQVYDRFDPPLALRPEPSTTMPVIERVRTAEMRYRRINGVLHCFSRTTYKYGTVLLARRFWDIYPRADDEQWETLHYWYDPHPHFMDAP